MTISLIFFIVTLVSLVAFIGYSSLTTPKSRSHNLVHIDMGYVLLIDIQKILLPIFTTVSNWLTKVASSFVKGKKRSLKSFFTRPRFKSRGPQKEKVTRRSYLDTIIKRKKIVETVSVK